MSFNSILAVVELTKPSSLTYSLQIHCIGLTGPISYNLGLGCEMGPFNFHFDIKNQRISYDIILYFVVNPVLIIFMIKHSLVIVAIEIIRISTSITSITTLYTNQLIF